MNATYSRGRYVKLVGNNYHEFYRPGLNRKRFALIIVDHTLLKLVPTGSCWEGTVSTCTRSVCRTTAKMCIYNAITGSNEIGSGYCIYGVCK